MTIKLKPLVISIAIPLTVGGLSSFLTKDSMQTFAAVSKPPLSPPGWLFPVVWTVLYVLMGIASYIIYDSGEAGSKKALTVYGVSLFFNFFWSILFFNLATYLFSFIWLVILLGLIIWTAVLYYPISKTAAYLMIPYIVWVTFAGYLNLGIYLLN